MLCMIHEMLVINICLATFDNLLRIISLLTCQSNLSDIKTTCTVV